MLMQVRKALKGVVAWIVIVLLIIAFAAFGVPEINNLFSQPALKVGDASFARTDILRDFNRELTNRRLQTGEAYTQEQAIAQGVPEQVIQQLVARSTLSQAAEKNGLAMPRDVVRDYLKSQPGFTNASGELDNDRLQNILREYNMTAREFEEIMREDLARSELVDAVANGPSATSPFVRALLMRDAEQRTVSFVTVTDEMAGVAAEPTPDALKAYYERNISNYQAPEYRTFTAVVIRDSDFTEGLSADEAALRQAYEASKRNYEKPETRTIYQITYDSETEANGAVAALAQGKSFEEIAGQRGLQLAAVTFTDVTKAELLNEAVGDAVFADGVDVGGVVGPVQGVFGYTVAQVAGVTPPETQSFEEVRNELEDQLLSRDARKLTYEAVEALENAQDTGKTLAEAAEDAGVKAETFGPVDSFSFGPGGEIVGRIPGEVLKEAFALEEGAQSTSLELEDKTGYFFVAVREVTPPAAIAYDVVADEIETAWRADERKQRISAAVKSVRDAVAAGSSLADAAAPLNRAPITETIGRRPELDAFSEALVEQIFTADKGATVSGPAGAGGAEVIVTVDDISYPDDLPPQQIAAVQQYIAYQLNQELLDAYVSALSQDMGVKRDEAQIGTLFSNDS